jgi:uncharacterized protein YoaH (UPF0181 family)
MRMKATTRKQIEDALYAELQKIVPGTGTGDTRKAREFWVEIAHLVERFDLPPHQMMSLSVGAGVLASIPHKEPTPEELETILERITTLIYELRGTFKDSLKALPRKPGGGRRKLLSLEQERQVCVQVGGLYAQGIGLPEAFVQVARQYKDKHVSARTIKRAWEKRAELNRK